MAKKAARTAQPRLQVQPPVYVIKVVLKYDDAIWRRIEISSTQTLEDLHWAIFDAFDRYDEHLYAFSFPAPGYRSRAALREAPQYVHPAAFDPHQERMHDASESPLHEMALRRGRKFDYEFDFGETWWHSITFEGERPSEPKAKYPRVVESKGKSPPQYPDLDEDVDG
jgi:hypothetical protein